MYDNKSLASSIKPKFDFAAVAADPGAAMGAARIVALDAREKLSHHNAIEAALGDVADGGQTSFSNLKAAAGIVAGAVASAAVVAAVPVAAPVVAAVGAVHAMSGAIDFATSHAAINPMASEFHTGDEYDDPILSSYSCAADGQTYSCGFVQPQGQQNNFSNMVQKDISSALEGDSAGLLAASRANRREIEANVAAAQNAGLMAGSIMNNGGMNNGAMNGQSPDKPKNDLDMDQYGYGTRPQAPTGPAMRLG